MHAPFYPVGGWGGTLNYRRVQDIKELANTIRLYAKVERPTFDQLKAIVMTIDPVGGNTILKSHVAFLVMEVGGYFQTGIVRKTKAGKDLADWRHYHSASVWGGGNMKTGAANDPVGLPGPPLTSDERRIAGTTASTNRYGKRYVGILTPMWDAVILSVIVRIGF